MTHTAVRWDEWSVTAYRGNQELATLALLALAAVAGTLKVELADRSGRLNLGLPAIYLALLVRGAPTALLCAVLDALTSSLLRRQQGGKPVLRPQLAHRILFNVADLALSVYVAAAVFRGLLSAIGGAPGAAADVPVSFGLFLFPTLVSGLVYYTVNTGTIAAAIALSQRASIWETWSANFVWAAPGFVFGAVGTLAATCLVPSHSIWLTIGCLCSVGLVSLATHTTYRLYSSKLVELREMNQSLVACLALAIDARDPYTNGHISRVCYYAMQVANRLGMSGKEMEAVKIASMLHDVGKLGVPDHILRKPGKLTPEEYAQVQQHVTIGGAILGPVPFGVPVVPIVLSHHERYDGRGYPRGLKGEEIPIGGRVISVVDVFDALTSDRPYRKALTRGEALAHLRENAGSHFDPRVVRALEETPPFEEGMESDLWSFETRMSLPEPEAALIPAPANAIHQISRANGELYAMYEVSRGLPATLALDETLALILDKTQQLVEAKTAALFLVVPDRAMIRCEGARGLDADALTGMEIAAGEGVSGRVVESGESMVNAQASLDVGRRCVPGENQELSSALVVPIRYQQRTLGTISVYHSAYNFYTDEHRRLLTIIADHAGQAIESAHEYEATHQLALTDPLTGLSNARHLSLNLEQALPSCREQARSMAILLIDCDRLKQINDDFGHAEGNRALVTIARVLRQETRETDLLCRYAGDEFVLAVPGLDAVGAADLARRLQSAVGAIELLSSERGKSIRLGVSIGAAVFPDDGDDAPVLIAVADERMYRDKAGRRAGSGAASVA
jgi:diguanylate cyclase (GGDEF)-like protein